MIFCCKCQDVVTNYAPSPERWICPDCVKKIYLDMPREEEAEKIWNDRKSQLDKEDLLRRNTFIKGAVVGLEKGEARGFQRAVTMLRSEEAAKQCYDAEYCLRCADWLQS